MHHVSVQCACARARARLPVYRCASVCTTSTSAASMRTRYQYMFPHSTPPSRYSASDACFLFSMCRNPPLIPPPHTLFVGCICTLIQRRTTLPAFVCCLCLHSSCIILPTLLLLLLLLLLVACCLLYCFSCSCCSCHGCCPLTRLVNTHPIACLSVYRCHSYGSKRRPWRVVFTRWTIRAGRFC